MQNRRRIARADKQMSITVSGDLTDGGEAFETEPTM
jgi:hypothetical protein